MLGFRQCEGCGKELPEECFRGEDPRCRVCAREGVYRIAPGIIAAPGKNGPAH